MGEIVHGAGLVVDSDFVDEETSVLIGVEGNLVELHGAGGESGDSGLERDERIVVQRERCIAEGDA